MKKYTGINILTTIVHDNIILYIIRTVLLVLFLKPPSSLTPLLFLNLYTGSKSISVLSIKFFLLYI